MEKIVGSDNPQPGATPDGDAQRAELRKRLLAVREAMPDRGQRETVLVNRLMRWLRTMPVSRMAFYWPVRQEPDVSRAVTDWLGQDPLRSAALPVVAGDVLEFAPWVPGARMVAGAYNIPVPDSVERLQPQVLLVPCVGIDMRRYRLGYGGGFYDRTLSRMKVKPVTVGIAFDCGRLQSIGPRSHDVKLDLAITESGVL
jgi:5-formyltetrahydrofolate cyclo-ligase